MNYVIIGNSIAAVNAIDGIRSIDLDGKITVISMEKYHTYGRPLISYWLEGKVDDQQMGYRPANFFQDMSVDVILGRCAVEINPEEKSIKLDDGREVPYDRLLLATGGRPFIPKSAGMNPKNYYTFTTYDDVRGLDAVIEQGGKAVVLGAGPTGLKAVESLVGRGADVTLVELAERVWAQALDQEGAAMLTEHLQEKGVRVFLQDTITEITRDSEKQLTISLKSGADLKVNILIVSIGVTPNVELLNNIPGVAINRGVVVGPDMSTGLPGVYAAGDVVDGNPPLLPHAAVQGKIAGRNMAGAKETYHPLPAYNALGVMGFYIISAGCGGLSTQEDEVMVQIDKGSKTYRKIVCRNNRLIGVQLINNLDKAGLFRKLIEEEIDITSFKKELLEPEFNILYLPESMWQHQLAQ